MVSKAGMENGIKETSPGGQRSCHIAQASLRFLGLELTILCLTPEYLYLGLQCMLGHLAGEDLESVIT